MLMWLHFLSQIKCLPFWQASLSAPSIQTHVSFCHKLIISENMMSKKSCSSTNCYYLEQIFILKCSTQTDIGLGYHWLSLPAGTCTAKTQCRKFETNIPRKGIAQPQFQFLQSCICEIFIIFPRSVCLFCCRKICGPILGIYKSLTDT